VTVGREQERGKEANEKEEVAWLQRGRANWLRHGDRNTNFFHHFAIARKKRNLIKYLMSDTGDRITDGQIC
jgi:hypothetical protein